MFVKKRRLREPKPENGLGKNCTCWPRALFGVSLGHTDFPGAGGEGAWSTRSDKFAWVVTDLSLGTLKNPTVLGLKPKPSRGEHRDALLSILRSWSSC